MKRKLFSALLFGACLMASTSTFVSCKDYDDDIQNLQTQIDANSKAIAEIQKLIQSGSVITNVSSTANGVTVTLSNGNTFNVTNGKDGDNGKDGSVVKIGDNGNWFIDGKDTGLAAQGPKGDKGDKGEPGTAGADAAVKGEWYALSADCTKLEYYKDGVKDDSKSIEIAKLMENAKVVNAVKTDDVLAFYNLSDQENPIAVISLRTQITALDLWTTYNDITGDNHANVNNVCPNEVTFTYAEQKANTFPAKAEMADGSLTFKDQLFSTSEDKSLIVRVTPANATLKASEITLIDSKGADLSAFVECVGVEPYDPGLYTRSAESKNGLYQLTLKLKDGYDAEAFAKATKANTDGEYDAKGTEDVIFAVAVNEDNAGKNRLVASEWDVTVGTEPAKPVIDFTVNGESINDLKNRYEACEDGTSTKDKDIQELVWKDINAPAVAPITDPKDKNYNAGDRLNNYDNRQDNKTKKILPVTVGQDIVIDFSKSDKNANGGNIAGFYVALDYAFALESAPSELAAWTKYSYEGVTIIGDSGVEKAGTLFKGNKGTIKITSLTGSNPYDIIGFRVIAVNEDGTLCDPDGRAFYVGVGEEKTANTITGTILAKEAKAESDFISVDGIFTNDTYGTWNAAELKGLDGKDHSKLFTLLYFDKDKKLMDDGAGNPITVPTANVKYVKLQINPSGQYIDGATYTQTIEVTKKKNGVTYPVKTITAKMTKVMPTEFPKAFAFRPMQEIDGIEGTGIFKSYLRPEITLGTGATMVDEYKIQGTNVATGWTDLNDVFYGLDENYEFIVKNTAIDKDKNYTGDESVTKTSTKPLKYELKGVDSNKKLMDDVTKHDITANYLYKKCSMVWNAKTKSYDQDQDWKVAYDKNLQVIYSCWHHAESYAFAEGKAPEPQWTQEGKGTFVFLSDILAKSSYNDAFFGGDLKKIVTDNKWLEITKVEMYYGEQKNPYFTPAYNADITKLGYTYKEYNSTNKKWEDTPATGPAIVFNQKDNQVDHNPTADHVEKLKITFKDSYGHEHDYTLDVTVKKAAAAK